MYFKARDSKSSFFNIRIKVNVSNLRRPENRSWYRQLLHKPMLLSHSTEKSYENFTIKSVHLYLRTPKNNLQKNSKTIVTTSWKKGTNSIQYWPKWRLSESLSATGGVRHWLWPAGRRLASSASNVADDVTYVPESVKKQLENFFIMKSLGLNGPYFS